jgi:4-hydroxy-3-methylbut-2-enyl diphosphate reductase
MGLSKESQDLADGPVLFVGLRVLRLAVEETLALAGNCVVHCAGKEGCRHMDLIEASTMGFCNGVAYAVDKVERCLSLAAQNGMPAYSCGDFIHNRQVMECYEKRGLEVLSEPEGHVPGYIVIRAHGIPDADRRGFEEAGFNIVDGTCPTVSRSQRLIRKAGLDGFHIVIIGLVGHHETLALAGCETAPGVLVPSTVVEKVEDLEKVPDGVPLFIMIQTTFPEFESVLMHQAMASRFEGREVVFGNRVCPSSSMRREAVGKLCDVCDAVVVVGSPKSANTQALAEIVRRRGVPVWLVETAEDLTEDVCRYECVGITAGASTAAAVIEDVKTHLRLMCDRMSVEKDEELSTNEQHG